MNFGLCQGIFTEVSTSMSIEGSDYISGLKVFLKNFQDQK